MSMTPEMLGCAKEVSSRADGQDPADRHFDGNLDWDNWKSDPSVGAVLCGFDGYVSTSCLFSTIPVSKHPRQADAQTTKSTAKPLPTYETTKTAISS
jgi:hypothetical protein